MMRILSHLSLTSAIAVFLTISAQAGPAEELAKFSGMSNADIPSVVGGKVLTERGSGAQGRDLAVEALFFIKLSPEKGADFIRRWTGTKYPELETYMHGSVGDFKKLASAPNSGPVKVLVANTVKLDPQKPQLHVSQEEAQRAPHNASPDAMSPEVAKYWSDLLANRARAFASSGVSGQPPYFFNGEKVQVGSEISRLLKSRGKWQSQFSDLLSSSGYQNSGGRFSGFWTMFDVERQAALALGGFYAKPASGGSWQALDLQYYASSGHYALVTLYQLWPVEGGSLVWRGDLVSAPQLGTLRGVERLASSGVMVKRIEKTINRMKQDAR
ncbi:MAG TPA: hypothetical protein VJ719_05980 [Chthoniobacterales bacterium]|nr:hypothetical protein [Chthoniobacterales bacterium]